MTTVYDIVKKLYGEDVANAAMPLITYAENRAAESVPENHFIANNKSGGFTALRYFSDMNPWIDFIVIVKSEDRDLAEKMIILGMYEYWAEKFECYGDAVTIELEALNIDYKILYHDCDDESDEYEKHWSDIISTLDCETISDHAYPTEETTRVRPDEKTIKVARIVRRADRLVDDVIFKTRESAEQVLTWLEQISKLYSFVTIEDYYLMFDYKDHVQRSLIESHGWTESTLSASFVIRYEDGWLLNLPTPQIIKR